MTCKLEQCYCVMFHHKRQDTHVGVDFHCDNLSGQKWVETDANSRSQFTNWGE